MGGGGGVMEEEKRQCINGEKMMRVMQTDEDGITKEEKWMEHDGKVKQRERRGKIFFDKGEITRNWEQFLRFGSTRSTFALLFWPLVASGGSRRFRWTCAK